MTIQNRVTLAEAASGLARLVQQVREGEEVVLVQDGAEVARIVAPVQEKPAGERLKPKRQGGFLTGQIKEIDPDWWKPDDELADLFEGSESFDNEILGGTKPPK